GSKRRREGKEPESTSSLKEKASNTTGKSTEGSKSHQKTASDSTPSEDPMQTTQDLKEPSHQEFKIGAADDQPIAKASQHPECRKYTTSVTKTKAADYGHIKWIKGLVPLTICSQAPVSYDKYALWGISHWGCNHQKFYGSTVNMESARDVYLKRRIIVVIEPQSVKWHDYRHLDWITMHRDDDKLYKFKEGDFNRLCIQDIEDILLLLGIRMTYLPQTIWRRSDKERAATMIHAINKQLKTRRIMRSLEKFVGKLSNLTVEERFAFDVSLRMFTRSIVIQRRVEDLQLGVESYQKRLNLTQPDTYRPDLKLMRIDELHKFNDETLNDVRNTLDDRLKGIRMQYLQTTIWRRGDKDRAAAMIQAIDKMLKTRRIMKSLEKFVCGRLYEGDFRMLQRTI
nr:hypothetical protein [Tanacetum cinerariifolium]